MTRPGLVGHMRFKHGRDYKAPMLPLVAPDLAIVKAKAVLQDAGFDLHFDKRAEVACPGCRGKLIAALKYAGYLIYANTKEMVDCPECKKELIAQLEAEGYKITPPIRVRLPGGSIVRVKV